MLRTLTMTTLAIGLTASALSFACTEDGKTGFVPKNSLNIRPNSKDAGGITLEQFTAVIDKVEHLYAPVVASKGGTLKIVRKWTDGTVNAYALRTGTTWEIDMFGGLARHNTITPDGMSLVVCHELGHHLGGAPKKGASQTGGGGWWGGNTGSSTWATNEGGADYFATLKCLRHVFLNDNNAQVVAGLNAPQTLVDTCNKTYKSNKDEANICIRSGMAGKSVSNLFSVLGKLPETKFESPDTHVVSSMDDNHPKAQCRLDTYFQGAICDINMNEEMSDKDENKGACSIANGNKIGNRPLCWFKPKKI
jgi:hypothetical protein